tara:strand:- start:9765 stop:11108 length:1344 start_codon:yes stop_codon:yes gene_type:complete
MAVFNKIVNFTVKKADNVIGDSTSLDGAPNIANIPTVGKTYIGQNQKIIDSAKTYADENLLSLFSPQKYTPLDAQFHRRVADEFELLKMNNPNDPRVVSAYEALKKETVNQYRQMMKDGVKITFSKNPYPESPYLALKDISENNALKVYPTDAGGVDSLRLSGNPLAEMSNFKTADGQPMRFNDLFRAVHDYYGHAKHGVGFRAMGEENAYLTHSGMFSPEAMKALATETRGQNSFLNFGKNAEFNKTANQAETIYADQKFDLLPNNLILQRTPLSEQRLKNITTETGPDSLLNRIGGAVDDSGNLNLVHYSTNQLDRIDPKMFGSGASGRTINDINMSSAKNFLNRSFYGVENVKNPYRYEGILSSIGAGVKNKVQVPIQQIYNPYVDPDDLFSKIPKEVGGFTLSQPERLNRFFNLVDKQGYSGILTEPSAGKIVQMIDPMLTVK